MSWNLHLNCFHCWFRITTTTGGELNWADEGRGGLTQLQISDINFGIHYIWLFTTITTTRCKTIFRSKLSSKAHSLLSLIYCNSLVIDLPMPFLLLRLRGEEIIKSSPLLNTSPTFKYSSCSSVLLLPPLDDNIVSKLQATNQRFTFRPTPIS